MTRLALLFTVLLVLSALSLVSAQYRARQLFIDLDRARAVSRKLDVEWRTLQLDQTNYSKNSLIEAAAVRDLGMQRATPARTQFMTLSAHATQHDTTSHDATPHDATPPKDAPR